MAGEDLTMTPSTHKRKPQTKLISTKVNPQQNLEQLEEDLRARAK